MLQKKNKLELMFNEFGFVCRQSQNYLSVSSKFLSLSNSVSLAMTSFEKVSELHFLLYLRFDVYSARHDILQTSLMPPIPLCPALYSFERSAALRKCIDYINLNFNFIVSVKCQYFI